MRATNIAALLTVLSAACGTSTILAPAAATPDAGPPATADGGGLADVDAGAEFRGLQPGDVAELAVTDGVAGASLATPDGTEKFVVVVASTRFEVSSAALPYSIKLDGAPAGASPKLVTGCSLSNDPWKSMPPPAETPPTGTAAALHAKRTIHAPLPTAFEDIEVEAIAIGKHAVVWADVTTAHPANLDPAFVSQFLAYFDDTIMPRERSVFGIESDLDSDGRIALIFTPLTNQTAVAFFSGCDLVSSPGCATSNNGEYLYLTPPDAIAPPYNTPAAIREILSHELSHLIHFNRKVVRNKLSSWAESGYMIEGVGGFGQDVIGPQAGNLYVTQAGLDGINQFSLADTLVDGREYDIPRDGVLRGGSYLFVRWFYDRAGSDNAKADGTIESRGGPALLRTLLDAKESVAKALPGVAKASIADIGTDFYTTLAMSNRNVSGGVAPTNPCFSFAPTTIDAITGKQRGADMYAQFHGMGMKGPAMQSASKPDGKILAGGVEYLTVDAVPGQTQLDFTVKVDGKAAPRVRIGRLR